MKNTTDNPSYANKIIEILLDKEQAIGIFNESNIAQIDDILSVQKYDRPDGRKGLVINANTKGQKSNSTKICVDVRQGLASTEQLHWLIYDAGANCDIRLIVFSSLKDESDDANPTTDFNFIKDIVDAKNEYNLNIHLVNFYEPMPDDRYFHYFVYSQPQANPKFSLDDIESEIQFREGEFWICIVNSLDKDFYKNWPLPDGRFEGLGHHVDVGNIRVKVVWNDQGSKIAVYQTDGGNDLVNELWKAKKSDLRKLFKEHDIDLEHLAENLQMIAVKISDRPASWLLQSELREKMEFARVLHRNYFKMVDFVRDVTKTAEG